MESSWLGSRFRVSQTRNCRSSIFTLSQRRPHTSPIRRPVKRVKITPNEAGSGIARQANISRRCSSLLSTRISFLGSLGRRTPSTRLLRSNPFFLACSKDRCSMLRRFRSVLADRPPSPVVLPQLCFWLKNS